ncbi:TPA: hypothetical protein DDW35_06430 [Candidatus Sumerlaeota bacterium]|nr:hypothetical protein [Candidatus Sumerlaeota bacterium]
MLGQKELQGHKGEDNNPTVIVFPFVPLQSFLSFDFTCPTFPLETVKKSCYYYPEEPGLITIGFVTRLCCCSRIAIFGEP